MSLVTLDKQNYATSSAVKNGDADAISVICKTILKEGQFAQFGNGNRIQQIEIYSRDRIVAHQGDQKKILSKEFVNWPNDSDNVGIENYYFTIIQQENGEIALKVNVRGYGGGNAPSCIAVKNESEKKPLVELAETLRDMEWQKFRFGTSETEIKEKVISLINSIDEDFIRQQTIFPPLFFAIGSGWEDVVELLLEKGANPNMYSKNGPVFFDACYLKNQAIALLLLNHGANIDAVNTKGEAALVVAAKNGWASIVQIMVEKGADPKILLQENCENIPPSIQEFLLDHFKEDPHFLNILENVIDQIMLGLSEKVQEKAKKANKNVEIKRIIGEVLIDSKSIFRFLGKENNQVIVEREDFINCLSKKMKQLLRSERYFTAEDVLETEEIKKALQSALRAWNAKISRERDIRKKMEHLEVLDREIQKKDTILLHLNRKKR